jgi:hypothetical protein
LANAATLVEFHVLSEGLGPELHPVDLDAAKTRAGLGQEQKLSGADAEDAARVDRERARLFDAKAWIVAPAVGGVGDACIVGEGVARRQQHQRTE